MTDAVELRADAEVALSVFRGLTENFAEFTVCHCVRGNCELCRRCDVIRAARAATRRLAMAIREATKELDE